MICFANTIIKQIFNYRWLKPTDWGIQHIIWALAQTLWTKVLKTKEKEIFFPSAEADGN